MSLPPEFAPISDAPVKHWKIDHKLTHLAKYKTDFGFVSFIMLSRELQNVSILEAPKIETLDSRAVRRSENPVGASSNMVGIICPPG